MELDELKLTWRALEQRLERQNALQFAELRERSIARISGSLRPLFWGQLLQILFGIAVIVAGVWLWRNFSSITTILIAGITLHLYGVATIVAGSVVLGGIARVERGLPVLELQQRLAKLRKSYIISGAVAGLPWWVLWIVPPVVLLALHAERSANAALPSAALGWLAFGVAGLLATLWYYRWMRGPGRESLAKRWENSAVGSSLRAAQSELDALRRYAED